MKHIITLPMDNNEECIKQYKLILDNSINGIAIITGVNLKPLQEIFKNGGIIFDSTLFLTIECKKIRKINRRFDGIDDHRHNIGPDEFIRAIIALNNPEFISKHSNRIDNYTVYTEALDSEGNKMLVGFSINFVYKGIVVNNIDTVFGYKKEKYNNLKNYKNVGKRIIIFSKEKGWLPAPNTSPTLTK